MSSGKKTVKLEPDVYERVKAHKRDGETFSEAIERLIGDVSLLDLVDGEHDLEREVEMKAALDRTAEVDSRKVKESTEHNDT